MTTIEERLASIEKQLMRVSSLLTESGMVQVWKSPAEASRVLGVPETRIRDYINTTEQAIACNKPNPTGLNYNEHYKLKNPGAISNGRRYLINVTKDVHLWDLKRGNA